MRPRSTTVASLLLALVAVAGCGDDGPAAPAAPSWSFARVDGARGASDLAVLGGELLFVTGKEKSLHLLDRTALRDGGAVRATAIPIFVEPAARLSGGGEFVVRGFDASDLWGDAVDLQGIAARPPDLVYVADRTYRVVYWGRLERTPEGGRARAYLDKLFVVIGAERSGKDRSDWRDTSGGIAGLLMPPDETRMEDLVILERGKPPEFTVRRMDRFGLGRDSFTVRAPADSPVEPEGIAWTDGRYRVVAGEGAPVLLDVLPGRLGSVVRLDARSAVRAPVPPPETRWSGIACSPDGTTYLVSSGDPCTIAWRRDPAR